MRACVRVCMLCSVFVRSYNKMVSLQLCAVLIFMYELVLALVLTFENRFTFCARALPLCGLFSY